MEKLKIVPTDTEDIIRVYILDNKRAEIVQALGELDCVADLVDGKRDFIGVQISKLAEEKDTDAMYAMLRDMTGPESENYIIERLDLRWWQVSVPVSKRDSIMASLVLHKSVCTATAWDEQVDTISLRFLATSQHSDREDAAMLIKRLAEDVGEPEKPKRHPILNEEWHLVEEGLCRYVADVDGCNVSSRHPELWALVPDLLRTFVSYERDGNWGAVLEVLARTEIRFDG